MAKGLDQPLSELYERRQREALLTALASAFALIACADNQLDRREIDRFFEVVRSTDKLASLDLRKIEKEFTGITQALIEDYAAAREEALANIAKMKRDKDDVDIVLSASQIAIVADERLEDSEETVLKDICEALGVDPTSY